MLEILIILIILIFIVFLKRKKSSFTSFDFYNRFSNKFEYYKVSDYPLKLADQVYCIVMPDRKQSMIRFMNKLGINCKFLNAVTPNDLTENDYNNFTAKQLFRTQKKTRLPLQISFTVCYLDAIKNGYSTIIVFEDDIMLNADLGLIKKSISEFEKSDYSMFYMGYCYLNCNQRFKTNSHLVSVNDYSTMYCAHSIVYKVKYLKDMINYIFPMKDEFDVATLKYSKSAGNKLCIPKQVYFSQNKDLGTNNETLNSDGTFTKDPPTCIIK